MASHAVQAAVATALLSICMLYCPVLAAGSEEEKDRFMERYGDRLREVHRTTELADDLELARQLLDDARDHTDQPRWLSRLCRHAFNLTRRRVAGQEIAVEAMRLRARHAPETRYRSLDTIATIYRRQFATARGPEKEEIGRKLVDVRLELADLLKSDGQWERAAHTYRKALMIATAIKADREQRLRIRRKRDAVSARLRRQQRIDQLRSRLRDQPDDTEAARSLAKLLVLTGAPRRAAEYRDRIEDPQLTRHLALAGKGPAELTEDEALTLGAWYRQLASEEPEPGPAVLFQLACQCYDRFLHVHEDEDAERREAEQTRDQLRQRLERLDVQPLPAPIKKLATNRPEAGDPPPQNMRSSLPGRSEPRDRPSNALFEALRVPEELRRDDDGVGPDWIELLPQLRLSPDHHTGGWRNRRGGPVEARLPVTAEPAALALPIRIFRGSYRLHLRFTVYDDAGALRLILPVSDLATPRLAELIVAADAPQQTGFHRIDGHAPEQSRLDALKIQPNRLQTLSVQVTPLDGDRIRLSAGLNGQPLAQWEGPLAKLPTSLPETDLPKGAPALALQPREADAADTPAPNAADAAGTASFHIEFSAVNLKLLNNGEARMPLRRRSRRAP